MIDKQILLEWKIILWNLMFSNNKVDKLILNVYKHFQYHYNDLPL